MIKRMTLAATAGLALMAGTGCEAYNQPPEQTAVPVVDVTNFATEYAEVPPAVQKAAAAVVKFAANREDGDINRGSGVLIEDGNRVAVLTAEHVIEGTAENCGDQYLYARQGGKFVKSTVARETPLSTEKRALDAALLYPEKSSAFNKVPKLKVAETPPKHGEPVFLIGFQPTPDGKDRNPASTDKNLAKAAIIGGKVFDFAPTYITIVTGLEGKGYTSYPNENTIRTGQSGGAVVDMKGQVVGVVSKYTPEKITGEQFEQDNLNFLETNPVDLKGAQEKYQRSYGAPITPSAVKNLSKLALNNQVCKTSPLASRELPLIPVAANS